MVVRCNDGSERAPYLRSDINMGNVNTLPTWSSFAGGEGDQLYAAIAAAGYQGVQGGDPALARKHGLGCTAGGRINHPDEAAVFARRQKDAGCECASVHVGWGIEDDESCDRLVEAIIAASERNDFLITIETHRATITQDIWRTVKLIERHPDMRINADFSHWYTGLEMRYGDWEEKLSFIQPVFERVRFLHGRMGNSSQMQVTLEEPSMVAAVEDFKELWIRSFMGFLASAKLGDYICFNPELLHPEINYARRHRHPSGEWVEESDRWQDALRYSAIAKECFAAARARVQA